jgi:lauroyl/myristoyl acyltransferase
MRFAIGKTERADEVERLAREYVFQYFKCRETDARPWLATHDPIDGLDRLLDARSHGRGVVLHFLHHGQVVGMLASFGRHGIKLHAPVARFLTAHPAPRDRRASRTASSTGNVYFRAEGSYPKMMNFLAAGEVVAVSSDVHGPTRMRFLGRDVRGAAGITRLAIKSGAPIVPVTVHEEGTGQRLVIGEPIDPRDFASGPELQQEILRRHEPSVLAWPEAIWRPLDRWRPVPEDSGDVGLDDPRMDGPLLI